MVSLASVFGMFGNGRPEVKVLIPDTSGTRLAQAIVEVLEIAKPGELVTIEVPANGDAPTRWGIDIEPVKEQPVRMNEGVDPRCVNVEAHDVKHGRRW